MRKMRFAVFTSQFPGKVNSFFARDMRALINQGIELDVYSLYPLNAAYWQLVPDLLSPEILDRSSVHHAKSSNVLRAMDLRAIASATLAGDAVRILTSATHFGRRAFLKSLYTLAQTWAWSQETSHDYQHLIAYWGNYAATSAYVFRRLTRTPAPLTIFLHAGTDLYRDQVFLREKLLDANHIVVVCEFNRSFVKRLYPRDFLMLEKKITLHHLGLEIDHLHYRNSKAKPLRVVAVGTYLRVKGFDYFLHAIGQLTQMGVDFHAELIGDGAERKVYERIISQYEMQNRVTMTGWLPQDEVHRRIAAASVLVHPSSDIGDAVPTVIKEAMALGTPVIGADIAGIPELLDHGRCGILVPPRDVIALKHALITLLSSESTRQQIAASARRFAEQNFDMNRNGARLVSILTNHAHKN